MGLEDGYGFSWVLQLGVSHKTALKASPGATIISRFDWINNASKLTQRLLVGFNFLWAVELGALVPHNMAAGFIKMNEKEGEREREGDRMNKMEVFIALLHGSVGWGFHKEGVEVITRRHFRSCLLY